MRRSLSRSVRNRTQPPSGSSSNQKAKGVRSLAKRVGKGSAGSPKLFWKAACSFLLDAPRIRKHWKGRTTGTRPPASIKGVRSPPGEGSPPGSQGSGTGSSGRGLNSMSPARLPPKSATMKIRCLLASRLAPAQYWASMSRQHRSGVPPRTIPAPAHLPEGGIGTSAPVKEDRTALKSIRSFVENAPMTFSQTAITGYTCLVASLISCMIRMAW